VSDPVGGAVEHGLSLGLRIVELFARIKTRDPALRAAAHRARAENYEAEAERLLARSVELRRDYFSGGPSARAPAAYRRELDRVHRRARKMRRKALYWRNRAARVDGGAS